MPAAFANHHYRSCFVQGALPVATCSAFRAALPRPAGQNCGSFCSYNNDFGYANHADCVHACDFPTTSQLCDYLSGKEKAQCIKAWNEYYAPGQNRDP